MKAVKDSIVLVTPVEPQPIASKSQTAFYLDSIGLMNIAELDSTFIIRLMYATPNNFTGQLLYTDLKEAYLHPDAAKALLEAHLLLKAQYPSYRLIILLHLLCVMLHPYSPLLSPWVTDVLVNRLC